MIFQRNIIHYKYMLTIFIVFFWSCRAIKLVEYRLGYNYGEVFHDFSGNCLNGVNGASSSTTTYNTIATDRGAYFGSTTSQITLPPNDQVSSAFTLPATFTVASWVYATSIGLLYNRIKDSNNYFNLQQENSGSKIQANIDITGTSASGSGNGNSFPTGN